MTSLYYINTLENKRPSLPGEKFEIPKMIRVPISIQNAYEDGSYDALYLDGTRTHGATLEIYDDNDNIIDPKKIAPVVSNDLKGKSREQVLLERIKQLESSLASVTSKVTEMEPIVNETSLEISKQRESTLTGKATN